MPTYRVTDPQTGRTLRLTGDSAPTEQELEQIFSTYQAQPAQAPAQQPETPQAPLNEPGMLQRGLISALGPIGLLFNKEGQQTLKNIPGSAANMVGSVAQAVTSPIQTGKTLVQAGKGFVEKGAEQVGLRPEGDSQNEQVAQAILDMFKDRYGSAENIKRTAVNDPVGTVADVAGLLSGAGSVVGAAGKAGKVGQVARAGQALSAAADVIDPLQATAKATGAVARGATKVAGEAAAAGLGMTTGAGREVIKEAFRNTGPEFTAALRGETGAPEIVEKARNAMDAIKEQRRAEYLEKIRTAKEFKGTLDLKPVRDELGSVFKDFGIKVTPEGLDFSRSTISEGAEAARVQGVIDAVMDWGKQKGDLTVEGVDILKKRLDDFYSNSKQANAVVTRVKSKVRDILNNVPGYAEATKGYAEASKMMDDINRALSLGGKNENTIATQLLRSMRDNQEFRTAMLNELQNRSGVDLRGATAGASLEPIAPRGLVGRIGGVLGTPAAAFSAGSLGALLSPGFLASIATTSPRLVGEAVNAAGKASRATEKATRPVRAAAQDALSNPGLNALLRLIGEAQRGR